jgi:hypothetical protein
VDLEEKKKPHLHPKMGQEQFISACESGFRLWLTTNTQQETQTGYAKKLQSTLKKKLITL